MLKSAVNARNLTILLIVVSLAQFIITIDSTFMNVSLSTLVVDLHTTVEAIQSTIALYTLVMASLMIAGAKIGDIFGRRKIFFIGLIIYGVGCLIATFSQNIYAFAFGWSILEGIGAALMLPAMVALIAANFPAGQQRTRAYAIFAAVASVAVAIGPIIGGLFTTYLSWRMAFFSEIFVVLFIFYKHGVVKDAIYQGAIPKFDFKGFFLTVAGLVALVGGIILASFYGIIYARKDVIIDGKTLIQTGQISPTVWLVLIGLLILVLFYFYENNRIKKKLSTLVDVRLFLNKVVDSGSFTMAIQYLLIAGTIYALSLYLQMALGYSAIDTGISLLPLSIAVIISAVLGSQVLAKRMQPRFAITLGFLSVLFGTISMGLTARDATSGWDFAIGILFIGFGAGLVGSQNQNLVISSVPNKYSSEVSGILNTNKNVGTSLGTAIAGAMIITSFIFNFTSQVNNSADFTIEQKTQINQVVTQRAEIVSNEIFENIISSTPQPQQSELISINASARQTALTRIYIALGILGLLGLLAGLRIPKTKPLDYLKNPKELVTSKK